MTMKSIRRMVAGIALALLVMAVNRIGLFHAEQDRQAPVTPAPEQPQHPMTPPPPDIRELAGRVDAAGMLPPTPEQQVEEHRITLEQVSAALRWLASQDARERREGAEQLGAYPTPEAGTALTNSLMQDSSPPVRVAAATSLANFQEPGAAAIRGLLSVVRDPSEDVRHAALGTLDIYLQTLDADSARYRQIILGLRKLARSPNIDRATRETLSDLLSSR